MCEYREVQDRGEGYSLVDGDQLDVAHELLAKASHVVVHPQPSILDIEFESSFDGSRLELDGETCVIHASAYTSEFYQREESNAFISTDNEAVVRIDSDDDLLKPAVSNWVQKDWCV